MIKLTALLLMLVMTVGMICGCTVSTQDDTEDAVTVTELTVGLPYAADSEETAAIKQMIGSIAAEDGFAFYEDAVVTIVTVPEAGTEEYTKFIKKVADGKVDFFLAPSSAELEELIEDKKIVENNAITQRDGRFSEGQIATFKALSREYKRLSYSVPFSGSYQGLFINVDMFEQNEIPVPTDWASLNAAIPALIEKGVTPFAAGFADGAGYWLDEMILAEGGVAEHSALPAKGVINSWSRAVNDIKKFYDAGAFQDDALSNTHDVAVQQFLNKEAAMMVCSSKDIATGVDTSTVAYMSMPTPDTGIKEENAFIGQSELGFYFYSKSFTKNVDETTSLSSKMAEFITSYMASSEWYGEYLAEPGCFPFFKSAEDCMDTDLEASAWEMISESEYADVPISNYLLAYDELESGLVQVLEGQISVDEYLTSVTEAELEAQAAKKAEEKEKK